MKRLLSLFVVAFSLLTAAPSFAAATTNPAAEQYVNQNANSALDALATPSIAARETRFRDLFQQFADFSSLSNFVLGPQGAAKLRSDPALAREWQTAFLDYATAVYQTQLDRFRGNQVKVVGSAERVAGRDVVVTTEIAPRAGSRPTTVRWRILKRGEQWKVLDVAIVDSGNELWLAQQQKRDFAPVLGKDGDVRALIAKIKEQTANMRARIARGQT